MMASLNLQNCINIPDDYEGRIVFFEGSPCRLCLETEKDLTLLTPLSGYKTNLFCIPNHYTDAVGSVLIPHGMIQDRIEKLGRDVFYDMLSCEREPLHALCVLKGGYKFFADMLDKVNSLNSNHSEGSVQVSVEFIRLKSYENNQSTGEINIIGGEINLIFAQPQPSLNWQGWTI